MHAAIGVLAAALHREKTGAGQNININIKDAVFSLNAMTGAAFIGGGRVPQPEQEILNGVSYYDFYKPKDGRFFSVGSLE
ncbi:CoA transferase, partial [Bacillus paralicheniformis]|uniref:CoA transferase n=1 Tax=Bacillus paralicheniformis TaxID=1648923 RepID=UPI0020C0063F